MKKLMICVLKNFIRVRIAYLSMEKTGVGGDMVSTNTEQGQNNKVICLLCEKKTGKQINMFY